MIVMKKVESDEYTLRCNTGIVAHNWNRHVANLLQNLSHAEKQTQSLVLRLAILKLPYH